MVSLDSGPGAEGKRQGARALIPRKPGGWRLPNSNAKLPAQSKGEQVIDIWSGKPHLQQASKYLEASAWRQGSLQTNSGLRGR